MLAVRWLSVLASVSACGRLAFDAASTDAGAVTDVPADAGCTVGPWSPPTLVTELSSDDEEYGGTLSRDGRTLIFPSRRTVGGLGLGDIYMATRATTADAFSAPVNLAMLNSTMDESSPALSDDQLSLYFTSDRGGPYQLYVATRSSEADSFGAPTLLAINLTGLGEVGGPEPSADELTLYFDSTAGGPGGNDIWMATRPNAGAAWSTPVQVPGVNTVGTEYEPTIDDGGLTLYYISNMFEAPQDLVIATRSALSLPFGPPTKVPLGLGAGVGEYGADMSADGLTMELSIHLGAPQKTNVFLSTRTCLD